MLPPQVEAGACCTLPCLSIRKLCSAVWQVSTFVSIIRAEQCSPATTCSMWVWTIKIEAQGRGVARCGRAAFLFKMPLR